MARSTTRRPEAEEEEFFEDEAELAEEETELAAPAAPAVSDSRRRRMMKRGALPIVTPESSPAAITPRKDRPTLARGEEEPESGFFLVRWVRRLVAYMRDVESELRKVAWPTREEVSRLTQIVLVVTIIASIFLGFVSFIFSVLTTQLAGADTRALAGLATIVLVIVVAGLWLFRDRLFGKPIE